MNSENTEKKRLAPTFARAGAGDLLALLAINLAVPRKKVPPYVGVRTLKDLAELATVEYSVTKIVSYKDVAWYGDRKILFEAAATVKAGIDMNELADQDIKVKRRFIGDRHAAARRRSCSST